MSIRQWCYVMYLINKGKVAMKMTIVLAALVLSAAAQAETIDLYQTSGFGLTRQYIGVPNSINADIYINRATACVVVIDGVSYNGPTCDYMIDATTGQSISATLVEGSYRTCTRSGRGQHCSTHWTLQSGQIVR
jgi:hypothetical protein